MVISVTHATVHDCVRTNISVQLANIAVTHTDLRDSRVMLLLDAKVDFSVQRELTSVSNMLRKVMRVTLQGNARAVCLALQVDMFVLHGPAKEVLVTPLVSAKMGFSVKQGRTYVEVMVTSTTRATLRANANPSISVLLEPTNVLRLVERVTRVTPHENAKIV
jgi:hypothetical protein